MDAGVGTEIEPAREPAKGCSASSAWLLPVVLALVALATRAAWYRPASAMRRAARIEPHT